MWIADGLMGWMGRVASIYRPGSMRAARQLPWSSLCGKGEKQGLWIERISFIEWKKGGSYFCYFSLKKDMYY